MSYETNIRQIEQSVTYEVQDVKDIAIFALLADHVISRFHHLVFHIELKSHLTKPSD